MKSCPAYPVESTMGGGRGRDLYGLEKKRSKKFWAEMDRLVGDAKKLKKEIRKYKLQL
jgi:hypothetical protein